tara:strand:+ start:1730 stop:3286 length:1557 start_codon:yes stop_codon:yes gene_type:complete
LTNELIIETAQAACIESPLEMLRLCMPNVATLAPPPFHLDLEMVIKDDEILNDNIIAPRGHAKTSVTGLGGSLWRTFCVDAYYKRPRRKHFVLLVSRSRGHSINLLTAIKNTFEYSENFKTLFGYHGQQTARVWREDFVITAYGDIFMAKGMGQQVRGLNVGGTRPDFVLLDDGEDEENTKNSERMESNFRWFLQALHNVGGSNPCKYLNIGTPQHQRAIVFMLSDMIDWRTHHYSAIITDPKTGEETPLWPELRSMEWLNKKREALEEIGRGSVFQREYMCRVVGDEDQLFRAEDMLYYDGEVTWEQYRDDTEKCKAFLNIKDKETLIPINIFMGIDPASSVSNSADYTGIVVLGVDREGNRYVLDLVRRRMRPIDVGNEIIRLYKIWKPDKTQVETVGYQSMLADYIMRDKNVHIPGLMIKNNPRRGKTERLEGLQPLFYQKKFFLRRTDDKILGANMQHLVDELLSFPRSKHDDLLDGVFYANKGAYLPYHTAPVGSSRREEKSSIRKIYDWEVL